VVSWISQGAAGLATGSREVVGYPRDGTGATEAGAAGCLWMSRDSRVGSGRLAGGARYRGDEVCRGRQDMPQEMRHTAGGGCRRQVWRHKTSGGAEDASGGGRHIGRRKMHRKAEEASEAEAEFEMERRGERGFPLQCPKWVKCCVETKSSVLI